MPRQRGVPRGAVTKPVRQESRSIPAGPQSSAATTRRSPRPCEPAGRPGACRGAGRRSRGIYPDVPMIPTTCIWSTARIYLRTTRSVVDVCGCGTGWGPGGAAALSRTARGGSGGVALLRTHSRRRGPGAPGVQRPAQHDPARRTLDRGAASLSIVLTFPRLSGPPLPTMSYRCGLI